MADLFYIPYVRAVWRMLAHRLGDTGRLFIYGAGAHTRWLLSTTRDLPSPTIACIVDDHAPAGKIDGVDVRKPDCVQVGNHDVVLVSSDRWEDELAERAASVFGSGIEIVRLYESLPPGPYDKHDDRGEALARVAEIRPGDGYGEQQIVLITDQPRGRDWKIAVALRSRGWSTILLYHRAAWFDASRHFDKTLHYRTPWEALRLACDFKPAAYHISVNSDYRLAELFLQHRPGPVVVDSYDLVAGMYTSEFLKIRPDIASEQKRERFCLERADGLCCRSRECEHLRQVLGYRLAPRVYFADGCINTRPTERTEPCDDLHVVYAGKLVSERRAREPFTAEGRRLWLARAFAEQGIHFHVYPGFELSTGEFEGAFREYADLAEETPFFHLHRPVAADSLVDELARYDFGLFVYREFALPSESGLSLTQAKLDLCMSNKFYDYLDAGLPIIHNAVPGSHLADIAEKHGAGVDLTGVPLPQWGALLGQQDRHELKAAAARARDDYDVRRHAPRLVRFYESLRTTDQTEPNERSDWFEEHEHADHRTEHRQALV